MMDFTVLSQLIGSLGFPIVACGYMMISMNKSLKHNTDATNKLATLVAKLAGHCEEVHKPEEGGKDE